MTAPGTQPRHLTTAVQASGPPTRARIAHLMRFAQWALDDAAHGMMTDQITPDRLRELATGLENLGRVIRTHATNEDQVTDE